MSHDRIHRAYRIAYDGASYHGFQRQPDVATVEATILEAFASLDVDALDAGYAAAGRTDAGVSAAAQTVALAVPGWLDHRALNGALPEDIRAWATADVTADFHPRFDPVERVYDYHLVRDGAFDLERAREVANEMVGVHDFRDLSASREDTTRALRRLDVEPDGDLVRITAAAPSFVHEQVRRIVTLIDAVASGRRDHGIVNRILDPDHRVHGGDGVPPAPPEPLVLAGVRYDEVRFDPRELDRTAVFGERARALRGRAAAMASIADSLARQGDQHP